MDRICDDSQFWEGFQYEPFFDELLPGHYLTADLPLRTPGRPRDDFFVNANQGLGTIEPEIASDILMPTSSDDFSVKANQGFGMTEQWVSWMNFSTPVEAQDVLNANDFSISANQGLGTTEPRTEVEMTMPMSSEGDSFIPDGTRCPTDEEVTKLFLCIHIGLTVDYLQSFLSPTLLLSPNKCEDDPRGVFYLKKKGGFPDDTWRNLVVSGVVIADKRILYESYFKEAISSLPEWCLKEAVSSLETAREKFNKMEKMEKTNSSMFTSQEGRTTKISDLKVKWGKEPKNTKGGKNQPKAGRKKPIQGKDAWTEMISDLNYEVNGEIKTLMSGSGRDKIRMLTNSAQDIVKMVSLPNHGIQNLQQEAANASHLLFLQQSFRSIFLNLQTLLITEVRTGQNLPFVFETTFGMLNNGLTLVDKMGKTTASISDKLGTLVRNLKFRENILDKLLLKCSSNIPTVVESFLEKQRRTFIPVASESNLFNSVLSQDA